MANVFENIPTYYNNAKDAVVSAGTYVYDNYIKENWADLAASWNSVFPNGRKKYSWQQSDWNQKTKSARWFGEKLAIGAGENVSALISNLWNDMTGVVSIYGSARTFIRETVIDAVSATSDSLNSAMLTLENFYTKLGEGTGDFLNSLSDTLQTLSDNVSGDSEIMTVIGKGISIYADAISSYQDGVSETSYGNLMESSWNKGSGSSAFMSLCNQSRGFYFLSTTPLDSGNESANLYGNMLLGVPPLFSHITDPQNRIIASEYLRDARFLTIIPGHAQYNGSNMLANESKSQYKQTRTAESMLSYLKKNGVDSEVYTADRRYYTFKTDYEQYYSYLETMLNALWIKMGLGETSQDITSIYSFFNNPSSDSPSLKDQYKQGIGFLMNDPQVTESISSSQTNFGSGYSGQVNDASETYQSINYLTGMGTGSKFMSTRAQVARMSGMVTNVKSWISGALSNTLAGLKQKGLVKKLTATALGVVSDTMKFNTTTDMGAVLQQYAVTNGMKIVYPELWSDSNFGHTYSFSFNFVSPYGDPLSIFQYVMVPFCTLLTFGLPRQAADNGYVSPFFIRADMPGLFTCDFGLITDLNWTRGGNENLWTKDGLPRAISGTFSVTDLYPYLAMTKRLSFLSANPSYTSWLDSLAGLHVVNTSSDDGMNAHWKDMLNRVTGEGENGLKNTYGVAGKNSHSKFGSSLNSPRIGSGASGSIPWVRKT